MSTCSNYEFYLYNLVIPNLSNFREYCISYDKTYAFIYGLSRVLIIYYLFTITNYPQIKLVSNIFFWYFIFNLLLLLFVIYRKTKFNKDSN